MPRSTLILDSSQLTTYLECEQKWNLSYNEKLTVSNGVREDMAAGTYGHKLLELYYRDRCLGLSREESLKNAASFHLGDFPLSPERREVIHSRFLDYWNVYPKDVEVLYKWKPTIDVVNEYLIDTQTKTPLVEQGFSYLLLDTPEYLFVLEGKIDLIGKLSNETVWLDHKWQSRAHELYAKSIQFRNYALATNLRLGVINYIRTHKAIDKNTFVRQPISFSSNELRNWKQELIELYVDIVKKIGKPRLNRQACSGKFGYPCEFTSICEEANPETQQAIKESLYQIKEEWKPW